MKPSMRWGACILVAAGSVALASRANARVPVSSRAPDETQTLGSIRGKSLSVSINSDGSYSIALFGLPGAVLRSKVEADVNDGMLQSSAYPRRKIAQSQFHDEFGSGSKLIVTHTGLPGKPDLVCTIRLYQEQSWGDIAVEVLNTTDKAVTVQAIRSVQISDSPDINLNATESADRVLSDSYSEDRPQLAIRDLGDAPKGMLRAVGSQLIFNRQSGVSLFLGALTTNQLLTIFHLKEQGAGPDAKIVSYEVTSTGTTEIMKEESLRHSPPAERMSLSLPVEPGASLSSERLMFAIGTDYHAQLEQYGHAIKVLHKARVDAPTPIGWWSWTAYYFGLNEGSAITNAQWLAENLKKSGYKYFQIDEGYQYARGEYATPDANLFPRGLGYVADSVRGNGLTFGVWTAPFEVSERAWVYQNHKDWLLHNAAGQLIHIGDVTEHKDLLYVLDTTNPGAQEYLKQTYSALYNWGVRFIKMDFMDDSAVEGSYYRPNTTALEAQRIGLDIIRKTMGEDVVLDKDGSVMLNPVGICRHRTHFTGHGTHFRGFPRRSFRNCRALLHESQFLYCRSRCVQCLHADCRRPSLARRTTATDTGGGKGLDCSVRSIRGHVRAWRRSPNVGIFIGTAGAGKDHGADRHGPPRPCIHPCRLDDLCGQRCSAKCISTQRGQSAVDPHHLQLDRA